MKNDVKPVRNASRNHRVVSRRPDQKVFYCRDRGRVWDISAPARNEHKPAVRVVETVPVLLEVERDYRCYDIDDIFVTITRIEAEFWYG